MKLKLLTATLSMLLCLSLAACQPPAQEDKETNETTQAAAEETTAQPDDTEDVTELQHRRNTDKKKHHGNTRYDIGVHHGDIGNAFHRALIVFVFGMCDAKGCQRSKDRCKHRRGNSKKE